MAGHALKQLANAAIASGVPLFNNGDAAGCAAIYRAAVNSAASTSGAQTMASRVCAMGLSQADSSSTPTSTAWMLRYVLDWLIETEGGSNKLPARTLLDFGIAETAESFHAIDDRVMGGSSFSSVTSAGTHACFAGKLILEGGGFASVRYQTGTTDPFFFGDSPGMLIEARGDGNIYKLTLTNADARGGAAVSYQADFSPRNDVYETIMIPWSFFKASWRGR